MNDQELLRWARECANQGPNCGGCSHDGDYPEAWNCLGDLIATLAQRVEKLGEHCARYAEMLAVQQERDRWISVEEKMPEPMEWVLCWCFGGLARVLRYDNVADDWDFTVLNGHGYAFTRDTVTHWRPLPEGPEEGERWPIS